jgi:hypothetical protein
MLFETDNVNDLPISYRFGFHSTYVIASIARCYGYQMMIVNCCDYMMIDRTKYGLDDQISSSVTTLETKTKKGGGGPSRSSI